MHLRRRALGLGLGLGLGKKRSISSLKRVSDNVKQKRNDVSLYRRLLTKNRDQTPAPASSSGQEATKGIEEQNHYRRARDSGASSSSSILASLLRNCVRVSDGQQIHDKIIRDCLERNHFLGNLLIQMYGSYSAMAEAHDSFIRLEIKDPFAWNFVISSNVRLGRRLHAIFLFDQMQCEGELPNPYIFASLVSACASSAIPNVGKRIHARVVETSVESDVSVGNALVNMYEKCGSLVAARKVFDRMPERDTLSWTAIIAAYANRGDGKHTLQLFEGMIEKGIKPNEVTFVSILPACSKQAALTIGKRIHLFIADSGYETNSAVENALIDMYGKCGSLEASKCMFDKMEGRRDVVSWTTMIAVYAQHGQPKAALKLFDEMQKEKVPPDEVTFVSVLSACSHGGFVKEGCKWWLSMNHNHQITPIVDHYNCMLDLLGRVGKLSDAEDLLSEMPIEPTFVSWMTLLSACKHLVDVERGERAAERAFRLDPHDPAPYVMLSNIYYSAGRLDDAMRVLNTMKEKGLRKPPGISSIEVNGIVHEFMVDDSSHPQKDEIYAALRELSSQMLLAGHSPKSSISGSCFEEKEHSHSNHSEMLAIAFGLVSTTPRTTLVITKNLRACPDCHSATKFISKLTSRKIVVRDAHRFHHIEDGVCSCGDYW